MDPREYQRKMIDSMKERTGRTLEEWVELVKEQPFPEKHREKLNWFKAQYGLGQNSAMLVLEAIAGDQGEYADEGRLIDNLFAGPHAVLRPLYDWLAAELLRLGGDVKIRPGKTYVPFYRDKLFAMAKPHKGQLHIGLALPETAKYAALDSAKGLGASARISKKVSIASREEMTGDYWALIRAAYDNA